MTINTYTNVNINPFNLSHVTKPSFGQVATMQNVFVPQIIEQTRVQVPLESEQIKILNLKDNLHSRFLPQNFIAKYLNDGFVKKQIQNNPQIKELLAQKGLSVNPNLHNVHSIIHTHLIPTNNYAKLIMEKSGISFSMEDYSTMEQAALLHDIGKIFIPSEILNKKGDLSKEEREIMQLHDTLGVELLKGAQFSQKTLNLIGAHHNYDGNENNDILVQILKIADIYSALKENRSYKTAMSEQETFDVLYKKAQEGEFDIKLVNTLKQVIHNNQNSQNVVIA